MAVSQRPGADVGFGEPTAEPGMEDAAVLGGGGDR